MIRAMSLIHPSPACRLRDNVLVRLETEAVCWCCCMADVKRQTGGGRGGRRLANFAARFGKLCSHTFLFPSSTLASREHVPCPMLAQPATVLGRQIQRRLSSGFLDA